MPTLDEMADKMDMLMWQTLEHLRERVERGGEKECEEIFGTLLRSFESTVMETSKAKFTQVRSGKQGFRNEVTLFTNNFIKR